MCVHVGSMPLGVYILFIKANHAVQAVVDWLLLRALAAMFLSGVKAEERNCVILAMSQVGATEVWLGSGLLLGSRHWAGKPTQGC